MNIRKVCLINPPTTRAEGEIFFPMGLVVLGSVLKAENVPVEIVDFDLALRHHPHLRASSLEQFEEHAINTLEACDADLFGISSICSNFPNSLSLAQAIRRWKPEAKIVLGGPQPSAVPQKTLECFPAIDVIAIGEGEKTILDLVRSSWSSPSLKSIPGICFRSGDEVITTPSRALLEDLDELPFPDFSLVKLENYFPYSPGMALVEAGRGCPYRCSFCSTAEFWSRKYRAKSPGRILEEMRVLHRDYGLNDFPLTHDNFTTSPKYIRKFCEYFIEHNHEGFTWNSSSRTDSLRPGALQTLQKAGCNGLYYGVDSGSARIQKSIDKNLDLAQFKEVLQETVDSGMSAVASFVLGFPGETKEEIDETILLGLWAKCRGAGIVQYHRLSPLAGTKIYHENKENLNFIGVASDMSYPVMIHESILPIMEKHPDLFSSFYAVPTPQLEPLDLMHFSHFFFVIVNKVGKSIEWIFNRAKQKPTDLFLDWVQFTKGASIQQRLDPAFILDSFDDYL